MAVKKLHSRNGASRFAISGSELVQIQCVTIRGATLSISIQIGRRGVDGKEYFAVDVMHDPATDIEFSRDMPQSITVRGRLPKKKTPMGIMDSHHDWKIGKTSFTNKAESA